MIYVKKKKPKASKILDTYWKFAAERQNVFFNRIAGELQITKDPILLKHKFTNAYRASDRVSQYLIKEIIYKGDKNPVETLFRILLFKTFNKIDTWELLKSEIGEITWRDYNFKNYNTFLSQAIVSGEAIYSGAYIMASGKNFFGYDRKHQNHLRLIEFMLNGGITEKVLAAKSMSDVYNLLLSYPTIGRFLAYQYTIDINYSELTNFSEMDFVVPGPGASDGIKKCFLDFGDYSEADIIHYVTDLQEDEFNRLGIEFKDLWGRRLQLIDCQNIFCETDKYSRIAHPEIEGISQRKRIKQLYNKNFSDIDYYFPPKWKLSI